VISSTALSKIVGVKDSSISKSDERKKERITNFADLQGHVLRKYDLFL